jgi:uncharacterized membrane protein
MKRKFLLIGMAMVTSFVLISCTKDNGGSGGNNGGNNGGTTPGTTPGPLFTAVKTMMQTNCAVAGCHTGTAAAGGQDFTVNTTIVAQKDRIKIRSVDQAGTPNQMPQPPRAALSAADQKKITDWITAGGALTN